MENRLDMAATCVAVHIDTFRRQTLKDAQANFGEPCQVCPLNNGCNGDWLTKMESVLQRSGYKINMAVRVQS